VDLATVEVDAMVPAGDVAQLAVGQEGEFQLESGSQWFKGTVRRISPSTSDPNRFFDVYLHVQNQREDGSYLMRPGMYAEVRFVRHHYADAVGVPADAVVYEGGDRVIYLVKDALEKVPVQGTANPGEGGGSSLLARFGRGLARLKGMMAGGAGKVQAAEQQGAAQYEETTVQKAVRTPVQVGVQSEQFLQVVSPDIGTDALVIVNPRDAIHDGTKVQAISAGQERQP
jgi:multidrug efflux pump subunit AcrA (membrane-fusion protein)